MHLFKCDRFFFHLIQSLVFYFSPDLVSSAADALLPLLLCEQGLYQVFSFLHIEEGKKGSTGLCFRETFGNKITKYIRSQCILVLFFLSSLACLMSQRLGNELIERQQNETLKSRLANALHGLTSANQLTSTLERKNYQIFRKNLTSFLIEVRGFLRTK